MSALQIVRALTKTCYAAMGEEHPTTGGTPLKPDLEYLFRLLE